MSSLQDRINDEINNIVLLPDPLTPEQREHLKSVPSNRKVFYVQQCIKANQQNQQ